MNDHLNDWFGQNAGCEGILACGIRHADRSTLVQTNAEGYADEALENALRCVTDLFQVLHLNRLDYGRVSWIFNQAVLHCERRPDGVCLGVFTPAQGGEPAVLDRLFAEFRSLPATPRA